MQFLTDLLLTTEILLTYILAQVEIEQLIEPVIRYEAPAFDFKLECKVTLFDDVTAIKDEVTERQACEQIRHILSQKQVIYLVSELRINHSFITNCSYFLN